MDRTILGRPLRAVAFDAAVSGSVAIFAVGGIVAQPGGWVTTLVGVAMAVALLFRRAHASAVAVVVALLALTQVIAGWGPLAYDVAVLIAMYSVVKYADRLRDGIIAGVATLAGVFLATSQMPAVPWWAPVVYFGLITGAAWLVGLNVRTRRLYVLTLEERAATLEREREAQARAAVAEERTRIARELHDVVAHSMAVMIVQADGARYMLDHDPATAREAVKIVADTGRQALQEMRRLVGVLREPTGVARDPRELDGSASTQPDHRRPVLADLPVLLEQFHTAGLQVRYTTRGETPELPASLELTVYRVVQEALTNALKHAGVGAEVEVTLDHTTPGIVVIRIVDDGRGRPVVGATPPGGHGLTGLCERLAVYDGSLRAGPRLAGGWQVDARLPLPSTASATEVSSR